MKEASVNLGVVGLSTSGGAFFSCTPVSMLCYCEYTARARVMGRFLDLNWGDIVCPRGPRRAAGRSKDTEEKLR